MADSQEVKDKVKGLLNTVVKHFDGEDRIVRNRQLRQARRLKLYWNNFSQIYWSEEARDYRIYSAEQLFNEDDDQAYYDRPVNVFRAFLETIIAALSISIPAVYCVPDDADNPNDLSTAKTGTKIAELIYKHNDVIFWWLYALYVHYTEGMVACYSYENSDKSYGEYNEKKYKNDEVEGYFCPECQAQIQNFEQLKAQQQLQQSPIAGNGNEETEDETQENPIEEEAETLKLDEMDEFSPGDDDIELHEAYNEGKLVCPECAAQLDPDLQKSKLIIPRFVGMTKKAKSRICFDIMGTLYVKIANYAKKQCDTPYLIWSNDTHYANAIEEFPDLWDEMPQGGWSNTGIEDPYEQYARLNPVYRNAFPNEQVTIRRVWLRHSAFNILKEEDADYLKKKFPDGCHVNMVNAIVADYENECLDDCWTLTINPMHDYINHDPTGEQLVNIQDITNDLISLTLQTIEHGITQTWADPSVVNFAQYKQQEAQPGTITPTKPQAGKNISDAFFSTKGASLSPEIFQFYQILQQLGQFVSAAMPSIFGGSQESGSSRTASEYAMSRSASLNRLQTVNRMFNIWWKDIFGKAIPAYMKIIQEDERYVIKNDLGSFENVWIRKAELQGKIGSVELENSDQMPVSDDQKADIIMKLFELNNEEVMAALTAPENLPMLRKVVKITDFKMPGEDDRQKQYEEITELLNNQPTVLPPSQIDIARAAINGMPVPQPQPVSSVEIDPDVDNHGIQAEICRTWAVSEAGRLAKLENPAGYQNVLLHMKAHLQALAAQQPPPVQMGMPPANQTPAGQPGNTEPPISEVNDARTPIQ